MRIAILGPLEVLAGDHPVPVSGPRLRGLLIRLALDAGRTVSVGALAEAVWPDRAPKRPEHALHELVSRLRRALPDDAAIASGAGWYRLDVPVLSVDALRFERLVRGGMLSVERGDPDRAICQLREGLSLWRGPALVDIADLPFAAAAAIRLDELRISATESVLAAELTARPGDSLLIAELEELIASRPLRERLRLLHIRALHDSGRTAEALATYDRYRTALSTELGTDPGPDLTDLHLELLRGEVPARRREPRPADGEPGAQAASRDSRVRPGRESAGPQLDSRIGRTTGSRTGSQGMRTGRGEGSPTRLRAPLTSFVGRERELVEVGALVRRGRLVTLVGPGGAGKTRLAVAVAAELSGRFPGGVAMAELAAISDVSDLPHAVASSLGVAMSRAHEPVGADPVALLVEALPTAPTLLVLDNCEHLVEGVAGFAENLLGRVPQLRILATSRRPLGIIGETLWETAPLAVPPPNASDAGGYSAVRLFLDRAAAVRATLAVSDAEIETVAEICRRLDGLPLALELAAAKLRVMPLATLRARLGDRFTVLAGGNRTALPRHRTLRAVLDWDWELLDEAERTALARLAVFVAPFTPCGAESLGVLSAELEALVDKSLVQLLDTAADPSDPSTPQPRYRMLETVRRYGLERLTARGELDAARTAHAAFHLDLAERAQPRLRGRDQLPWLRLLDADRDNLLAALRFSHESRDAETAARLGSALGMYWALHGAHAEAVRVLRPVLHMPTDHPHPPLAAAFALHSMLAAQAAELSAATDDVRRWIGADLAGAASHSATDISDQRGDGATELAWGLAQLAVGRVEAGLAAIEPWLGHPDAWTRGMFWLVRSFLNANESGVARMDADLWAAAECFEAAGERWGRSTALNFLAFARATLGDLSGATEAMSAALVSAEELGNAVALRIWLVMIRLHSGDVDAARADLDAVPAESLSARDMLMAQLLAADIARIDGDMAESARRLRIAEGDLNRVMSEDRSYRAMFGLRMGLLRAAEGRVGAAAAHCADAWADAMAIRDMPMAAEVSVGVARTCLAAGLAAAAAEALGAGHALRGAPDARYPDIVALRTELAAAIGDEATVAYERGRALGRADAVSAIEACLAGI
ncbi:AfsR/SARP family transcriptional regulator [Nocardia aurantiaca]|uniref:AfsR/SARP family transcriptional regulator n=1 Tax=Nocardia aurantiaca TaxID=2675850 RepID=UPI0018A95DE0|nr:BTAD domain-containing putative transcriptional regulator [Nocardia aurantiaca]